MTIDEITKQHKFCFICAGQLEQKENNLLVCTNCNYHKFINPTPCNGAILTNENGEILLIERKFEPMKGYWDLTGGFVDPEETLEESMIRELKEETELEVKGLKYFCSEHDTYLYDGITIPTVCAIFTGTINNEQEIKVHDDVAGYKFFKLDEIPFDKLAFKSIEDALRKFITNSR
ncbi:MAG TPA: NUDIX domain-containing protein [Patescibacteria group bacterium]|nr:NUDIX domain-containing protein [Patescibacteria group bacterium]